MTTTELPPAAAASPPPPRPKKANPNALLMAFRKYHSWFGVFAAGFLVMIAVTGIYLNHKDTFRSLVGGPTKEDEHRGPDGRTGLPAAAEIAALTVTMPQAVDAAAPLLADRPVERVELRAEHGRLVYKVKAVEGPEAVVDAQTGAVELKAEKAPPKPKKPKGDKGGEPPAAADAAAGPQTAATAVAAAATGKGMDWGKAIKDLHTGKIGGDAGKLLIDLVAVVLIALTLTGLYLWAVPELRKRRSARLRAAAQGPSAA